jgi:hypothetical protein
MVEGGFPSENARRGAIKSISIRRHVLGVNSNAAAASQLAIDHQMQTSKTRLHADQLSVLITLRHRLNRKRPRGDYLIERHRFAELGFPDLFYRSRVKVRFDDNVSQFQP